jgi:antitoxin (DNA-binding transcriptional repressor) of toxin-antitoxin stability system
VKEITVQQLHEETERWIREAADNGGIAITDHNRAVATLSAAVPIKRTEWLRHRLDSLAALPSLAGDSADLIALLREERA